MKPRFSLLFAGLVLALGAQAATERAPARQGAPKAGPAHVIVRFKADTGAGNERIQAAASHARTLSTRLGLALADGPAIDRRTQALQAEGISSAELAKRLSAQPEVEFAEVDHHQRAFATPNDPLLPAGQVDPYPAAGQWYLRAPSSTVRSAINAQGAWDHTRGSNRIVVAVVDTGVRANHPDLKGKLLPGYDFVADVDVANDGNGRDADESDPGDWITEDEAEEGKFEDCDAGPSSWHGTQTAGLVGAATNNLTGIAGAGYNLKVLPVRALGKCGGRTSDITAAMRWAAGLSVPGVPDNANPARVINLSLGSTNACSKVYQDTIHEINALGVVIVVAAGNEGVEVDQPANCDGVIAVAGLRHQGSKVGYSNLGEKVAIAAPAGNCVNTAVDEPCLYPLMTTTNDGTKAPGGHIYSDAYNASFGTSFASPLVAATAGMILSLRGEYDVDDVRSLIQRTARAFPTTGSTTIVNGKEVPNPDIKACKPPSSEEQLECYCTTSTCGAGMLDMRAAVAASADAQAVISVPEDPPGPGDTLTASAADSSVSAGREIAGYQWTLDDDGGIASFVGATNRETVQVTTSGAGEYTLRLVVTDSEGDTDADVQTVTVKSSGGGGAVGAGWLLSLLVASGLLRFSGARRKA